MLDVKLKLKPGHTSERDWMTPSPLKTLVWNVTYACNFHCGICFTDAGRRHPDELTTREAKEMLTQVRAAGVKDIIISGGEPFMRKDMVRILSHMADLGISSRIATNGSLVTDEILDRLRRDTLTKSFQVSLDTVDPKRYSEIMGCPPQTLESTIHTLRSIRGHGFHTTVSTRLTPRTLPGIPALLDFACAEGWSTVTIHCPVHTRRTEGTFPQGGDVLIFLDSVIKHFRSLPQQWLIETYIPWAQYHPAIKRFQKHVRFIHRGCRAGRDRLTINPAGSIAPCVCMDIQEAYIGNVRQDNLLDVFHSSPFCEMMRHPQEHGICTDCSHVDRCGGGCRAAALALTGELNSQDRSCPVWKSRAAGGG